MTRGDLPQSNGYIVVPRAIGWSIASSMMGIIIGGVWFAALQFARLDTLERSDIAIKARVEERGNLAEKRIDDLVRERDRMIRVEEQMRNVSEIVRRIEDRLSQASPRPPPPPYPP